ncbi:hypothetical protein Tco_0960633 [Tanacetum coccineum]
MSTLKFIETHNLVSFLDKPEESKWFEQIIDFLNASSVRYALMVNPTIYTSCIKQFWATAKTFVPKLSDRVLAMENTNTSQAAEITTLKERVKMLEKKRRSRTYKLRRLYKGRKLADLDADTEVTLIDETQGRNDEDLMFDTGVLNGDEVFQKPMVNTATTTCSIPVSVADPVTTAGEVIKSAKPKAVTTAATMVTPVSSRPKAKGIVFHDQEEQAPTSTPIVSPLQLPQAKDKGKAKMVEPEKPLKKKDQIAIDEEVTRNLEAQLHAELEEEDRLSR